jgi:hypothetical protein
LARSLTPARMKEAHDVFRTWLSSGRNASSSRSSADGITIETGDDFGEAVTQEAASDPTSPLRDAIFLRFARQETLDELDIEVPDQLAQALSQSRRQRERVGWWAAGMIGVVLVAVTWWFPILDRLGDEPVDSIVVVLAIGTLIQILGIGHGVWRAARFAGPLAGGRYGPSPTIGLVLVLLGYGMPILHHFLAMPFS